MATILVDVPDDALVRSLSDDNSRLRAQLDELRAENAELAKWPARRRCSPVQRRRMSIAQTARHAKRRAGYWEAALTASLQTQPELDLNFPVPNGGGHVGCGLDF